MILLELHIKQFALIEEIRLTLTDGMTVFTGETGAGKSILVDALGAVFGRRSTAEWVRHGAKQAEISACIDYHDDRVDALLAKHGIDADNMLLLRRVINADGRSRSWLNGVAVPVKTLQQMGGLCLDLHGQHQHQALMEKSFQRSLLEQYVPPKLQQKTSEAWQQYRTTIQAMDDWIDAVQQGRERETWLREQLGALQHIEWHAGLLIQLEQAVAAASHVAHIQQAASHALLCLDEGEPSARSLLAEAAQAIHGVTGFHPSLQNAAALLQQVDALLGELPPYLREAEDLSLDATHVATQESRLNALLSLLNRHDCDETALLNKQQQWQTQLDALETASWDQERLQTAVTTAKKHYTTAAKALHDARVDAATRLIDVLRPWLDRLALADMRVRIDVLPSSNEKGWRDNGWDDVMFMLASNVGEPFKSLQQVASGGELSRLALALKACNATMDAPAIAVFDEVDVGIGGETAWCIAKLLADMGQQRQVLVVSHLAQVAAVTDHHICINKFSNDARTRCELTTLSEEERQQELARMLGDSSEQGREQAKLLQQKGRNLH